MLRRQAIQNPKNEETIAMSVFDENYQVLSVDGDRLLVRGERSGDVLTIVSFEPYAPLSKEQYPVGKIIVLTDPADSTGKRE